MRGSCKTLGGEAEEQSFHDGDTDFVVSESFHQSLDVRERIVSSHQISAEERRGRVLLYRLGVALQENRSVRIEMLRYRQGKNGLLLTDFLQVGDARGMIQYSHDFGVT